MITLNYGGCRRAKILSFSGIGERHEKPNDSKLRVFLKDHLLSVIIYRFLVFVAKLFPFIAKPLNTMLTWNMKGPLDRIEKSYKVYVVPEPPLHRETEWTFEISKAKEILRAYKKFITRK
jgi:hypothetical protein